MLPFRTSRPPRFVPRPPPLIHHHTQSNAPIPAYPRPNSRLRGSRGPRGPSPLGLHDLSSKVWNRARVLPPVAAGTIARSARGRRHGGREGATARSLPENRGAGPSVSARAPYPRTRVVPPTPVVPRRPALPVGLSRDNGPLARLPSAGSDFGRATGAGSHRNLRKGEGADRYRPPGRRVRRPPPTILGPVLPRHSRAIRPATGNLASLGAGGASQAREKCGKRHIALLSAYVGIVQYLKDFCFIRWLSQWFVK